MVGFVQDSQNKCLRTGWWYDGTWRLELDHLTLTFLVTSQFEMLATFDWGLFAVLAFSTFHTESNFLGCLCLWRKKNTKQNTSSIRQWTHEITHKCFRLLKLPSFWRLVLSDHQNLVVYDRNDDGPGLPNVPSTFCIVSLCAICGTCTFCKKYDVVLVRSPKKWKKLTRKN